MENGQSPSSSVREKTANMPKAQNVLCDQRDEIKALVHSLIKINIV